jgi:predicted nucleic acid-binding protein
MPVVSDTSPLLGLAAIGHLELLREQFGAVLIPAAVLAELKLETDFRGVAPIRQAMEDNWLERREVQNTSLVQALSIELDRGEAEALALAIDLGLEIIIMDEQMGRTHARTMGLKSIGVLGILLRAKKTGRIPSLEKTMQALRQEIGFFIADDLYRQILKQAGE